VFANSGYGLFITAGATGVDVAKNLIQHNTMVDSEFDCVLLRAYSGGRAYNNRFEYNIFYGPSGGNASYRRSTFNRDILNTWDGNIVQYNQFYGAAQGKPILIALGSGSYSTLAGAASAHSVAFGSGAAIGREGDPFFVNRAGGDYNLTSGSPARDIGPGISGQTYNGQADAGRYEFTGGGANQVPTATIVSISNRTPTVNTAITFSGSGTDTDGSIAAYEWEFGDGTTSTSQNPSKTYTVVGTFPIRFRVRDNANAWSAYATDSVTVRSASSAAQLTFDAASVTASSFQNSPTIYPPSAAVDGVDASADSGTVERWIANSGVDTNITMPQWWLGKLASRANLESVKFQAQKWYAGRSYNYHADISDDPAGLTGFQRIVTGGSTVTSGDGYTEFQTGNQPAQWVKIWLNSNSSNNQFAGIIELKAYGQVISGGNTAQKYTPAAVTDSDGTAAGALNGPEKATDGKLLNTDPFSVWLVKLTDGSGNPRTVSHRVDLGSTQPVGRVRAYTLRPRSRRHTVQLRYGTGTPATTAVFAQAQVTLQQDYTEWTFPAVNARHLWFEVIGAAGAPNWFGLIEIEYYPA
jgi:PKD repeat protein